MAFKGLNPCGAKYRRHTCDKRKGHRPPCTTSRTSMEWYTNSSGKVVAWSSQCTHVYQGARCEQVAGHSGKHSRNVGGEVVTWAKSTCTHSLLENIQTTPEGKLKTKRHVCALPSDHDGMHRTAQNIAGHKNPAAWEHKARACGLPGDRCECGLPHDHRGTHVGQQPGGILVEWGGAVSPIPKPTGAVGPPPKALERCDSRHVHLRCEHPVGHDGPCHSGGRGIGATKWSKPPCNAESPSYKMPCIRPWKHEGNHSTDAATDDYEAWNDNGDPVPVVTTRKVQAPWVARKGGRVQLCRHVWDAIQARDVAYRAIFKDHDGLPPLMFRSGTITNVIDPKRSKRGNPTVIVRHDTGETRRWTQEDLMPEPHKVADRSVVAALKKGEVVAEHVPQFDAPDDDYLSRRRAAKALAKARAEAEKQDPYDW